MFTKTGISDSPVFMTTIKVQIEGTTPLLMNRYNDAAALASPGHRTALQGAKGTPREQATPKAYVNKTGYLIVPGVNMFRCIIDAGKYLKSGKSKLTTQKSSLIPSFLSLEELECPLTDGSRNLKEFEVDSRSVVNPSTGGRIMAHRPRLDKWVLPFTLTLDEKEADPSLVRDLVDNAGGKVGLGDFRPDRKGPFGKFKIIHWTVSKP
jgi:hypothetical protein